MKHYRKANEALEGVLREARQLLHPLNIFLIKGLDEVFDSYVSLGNFEKALSYGIDTLEGFR